MVPSARHSKLNPYLYLCVPTTFSRPPHRVTSHRQPNKQTRLSVKAIRALHLQWFDRRVASADGSRDEGLRTGLTGSASASQNCRIGGSCCCALLTHSAVLTRFSGEMVHSCCAFCPTNTTVSSRYRKCPFDFLCGQSPPAYK